MASLFLSYRRADSQEVVGRMYDRLRMHFPEEQIFRDLDSIPLGKPFPEAINQAVDGSQVALIVIGPRWTTVVDSSGSSRLDDPADFVHIEVERALASGILVVPVLVSGASMPKPEELPASLRPLALLQAIHVRPDPDFHRDMDALIARLTQVIGVTPTDADRQSKAQSQHFHSTLSLGGIPHKIATRRSPASRAARRRTAILLFLLAAGIAVAICVLTGIVQLPSRQKTTDVPLAVASEINQVDGAVMLYIPQGDFLMGSSESDPNALADEKPQRRVYLDGYWIYKTPVTVAQYRRFCETTQRPMPAEPPWGWKDTHPITGMSWVDAAAYAEWAGGSLPTEAQWEKAARGTDGRIFPWGDRWDPDKCWNSVGKENPAQTAPVGSKPGGASPYGLLDMSGHVWQWCADWFDESYYQHGPLRNPPGPSTGEGRVLRGCSWDGTDPIFFRAAGRAGCRPAESNPNGGFRCVVNRDPPRQPPPVDPLSGRD